MAAPQTCRLDGDDALPCAAAAPAPLPQPPPEPRAPLLLTPEPRGGGILRRQRAGKAQGRQVCGCGESASERVQSAFRHPCSRSHLELESAGGLSLLAGSEQGPAVGEAGEAQPPHWSPPQMQVHFRLVPKVEDLLDSSQDLPEQVQEVESNPPITATGTLKMEPSGGTAVDRWHQPSSLLATPIPHSTLALEVEAQTLREQGFNARQAAEELVQRSFVTRCAVEARVGEGLNIPRDQQLYQDLVSLQVPKKELLSSAVQEKLALVRPHQEAKKLEPDCSGPNLLAFYNPKEVFTETPFLEVEGLPPLKLRPRPRDLATTFFMYRKLQQWDS